MGDAVWCTIPLLHLITMMPKRYGFLRFNSTPTERTKGSRFLIAYFTDEIRFRCLWNLIPFSYKTSLVITVFKRRDLPVGRMWRERWHYLPASSFLHFTWRINETQCSKSYPCHVKRTKQNVYTLVNLQWWLSSCDISWCGTCHVWRWRSLYIVTLLVQRSLVRSIVVGNVNIYTK